MSRLLTTLLLYKNGYTIGKYISLEKKIQITKNEYYNALGQSSRNWMENENDDTPFIKYLLGTILAAYRDFESRVNIISKKMSAFEMVEQAVNNKIGNLQRAILWKCVLKSVEHQLKMHLRNYVMKGSWKNVVVDVLHSILLKDSIIS